jgi:hypothetical protein
MIARLRPLVLAGALLLCGCVHTNATLLSTTARPPVDPAAVVLYTSADKVPGKYDEIALIDSHGDEGATTYHKMLESMRRKAGEVGANGVILDSTTDPSTGAKVAHALIGTSADRKGKAMAIFIPSLPAPPPPPKK